MAKGTHNKTHKRNQSLIKKILDEKINTPRMNATHERLLKRTYGQGDDSLITKKKNSFRYPNDPDAEYPQAKKHVFIDRRKMNMPLEFLKRNLHEKEKNRYEKEKNEKLKNALLKAEGKLNEDKNIEIKDMMEDDIEENEEIIDLGNKKNKEKGNGMDIDDMLNQRVRRQVKKIKRKSYRHKRHSKNTMNF